MGKPSKQRDFSSYPFNDEIYNFYEGDDLRAIEDLVNVLSRRSELRSLKYSPNGTEVHEDYSKFLRNLIDSSVAGSTGYEVYIMTGKDKKENRVEIYGIIEGGEPPSSRLDILFEDIEPSELNEIVDNILTPLNNEPAFD